MRVDRRHGLAVAGLCLLIAVGPAAAQRDAPRPTASEPPATPPTDHGHSSLLPWLFGAAAVGAVAVASKSRSSAPPSDATPTRAQLLAYGPDVVEVQPEGVFAVYGLIRDRWPVALSYRSDPASATWLTVSAGGKTWTQGLESGRHSVQLAYAGGGAAKEAIAALFSVASARRTVGGQGEASKIEVFGLGAGPRALGPSAADKLSLDAAPGPARLAFARFDMGGLGGGQGGGEGAAQLIRADTPLQPGSLAISGLSFTPSARKLGEDFASFAYRTSSPFNHLDMAILRYDSATANGRTLIRVASVANWGLKAALPGTIGPRVWDGMALPSHQPSYGQHRLQVRGWETAGDESWVAAISPNAVAVP
jgi:hypothetical protein